MNQFPAILPALAAGQRDRSRADSQPRARTARSISWRCLAISALPWLVLTALFVPGTLIFDGRSPHPNGWRYIVLNYLTCFMLWAVYSPVIGLVWWRHPLSWPPRLRAVLAQSGCALAMVSLDAIVMSASDRLMLPASTPLAGAHGAIATFLIRMPFRLVLYTGTAAVFAAAGALIATSSVSAA